MKCYPVHDTEMETLSTLDTQTTAFFSGASLFLGIAISIWTNAAFAEKMTPKAAAANNVLAPTFAVVAAFLAIWGVVVAIQRRGIWGRIKRESTVVTTTPVA